jgi:5'-nucleotidase
MSIIQKPKKTLLLDMDDVTVDQSLTWVQRVYERTGIWYDREEWNEWRVANILPPDVVHLIFEEINKEPGFFRNLPAKEGAIEGIRELSHYYDIVFITASEHYAYVDKYLWIDENLPFLPKPNLILTHRKDLVSGDIFVDDGPHNLLKSPAKMKIVFDHPWNRHLTQFQRVYQWGDLLDLLLPSTKLQLVHNS